MRVLFDQGTPAPLRHALTGHSVTTAFEKGWGTLENGELLRRAQDEFDVLVTTDQNLRHQQNLSEFRLAVLVLPTTSWPKIRDHISRIADALDRLAPGECRDLVFDA